MATKPAKSALPKVTKPSRMTATWVTTAPPGDHTDPASKGLQLRVRPARGSFSRTWLLRYKWRGEPVRMMLGHVPGMSLAEARAKVIELRAFIDDGIDPRRAKPKRQQPDESNTTVLKEPHSIEALAHQFIERHVRPHRKQPEYAQAILDRTALKEWKGRDARSITPPEVIALLDGIVDAGSPVMANRVAALLGQLFKFGIHRGLLTDSPVKLLYRPGGKEKPRQRVLSDAELKALLSIEPLPRWERLHHAINLLLLTGQRRGELALARWEEIDFSEKVWTIPADRTKTGKTNAVPLSNWATEEFRALKREAEGSPFVFPGKDPKAPADPKLLTRNLVRAFPADKAKKKVRDSFADLGIEPFTLHDLRRTCRTGLARLKVAPHIAERVLNHAQEKIPGTYDVHDYMSEKRAALDKWAKHLRELV